MYTAGFRKFLIIVLIIGWGITFALYQNPRLYKDTQVMMGTFVQVISPDKNAKDIVFTEIKRIENLLSKYNPDSEVSKLNDPALARKGAHSLKVSPETYYIIKKAKEFWLASAGAFDITVGPLLDLWGFTDKNYALPKEEDIKLRLTQIGSDKIILNKEDNVVKFIIPGIKIDLGAIAKGFAVDCAVDKLKKAKIKSCLINAGGDIYCLGNRLGKPWRVAIQNPFNTNYQESKHGLPGIIRSFNSCKFNRNSRQFVLLKDQAIATSGNYEQFFLKNKKGYSHIFNPKTGKPADSGLVSVTVVAPDCLTADALATSIFVLGRTKGEELAKKFSGVRVIMIEEPKKLIEENQK